MTIDDRLAFLRTLEVAQAPEGLAGTGTMIAAEDGTEAAYVDAGSLVSFVAGVSAQHKSDALNSTLLAQLAANKKYNRETQTKEWYDFYKTVLENVGWVVQSFDFTAFSAGGTTFTVDAVVANVLAAIATQNDVAIVKSTIDAVKALDKGDGRLTIWDQNSSELTKGNFQITVCSESDGVLVTKIGAFYFDTDKTVTRVLWFEFSSSKTSFYKGGQVINLDEDVYSKVRQAVIDKLGQNAQDFVGDLEI